MTDIATSDDPMALQRARAAHLSALLEPWSNRRIAARTGIDKNAIGARLRGQTALTMSDIELLAPLIRMTPEELFKELRAVKLPHLDSNQEPIGSRFAPVASLSERIRSTPSATGRAGIVTPMKRARVDA